MEYIESLTPPQVKAARALLTWSQQDLARQAGIAVSTVADFERGQRNPTANNLSTIRRTFEANGVTFMSGGAVVGPPTGRTGGRPAGNPVRWIDSTDLVQWADRLASRASMPELISRLIRAQAGPAAFVQFPSDESVQTEGWDGISNLSVELPYVPVGVSGWEIGTQRENLRRKADEDFEKRTLDPGELESKESAFIFITPRRWNDKEAWRKRRQEEKTWADVRAYDADDLVHWIEMHPAVGLWLARALSKRPPGVRTLYEAWEEWSLSTTPPMHTELVLADRDEEAMRVLRWLKEEASALTVDSDSHGESIAFFHAALSLLPPEPRLAYETRCLVVSDADAARTLGDGPTSLILVLENSEAGLAQRLVARGHHVYVLSRTGNSGANSMHLPRPGTEALRTALEGMGVKRQKRDSLVADSAQSLSVLQRLLSPNAVTPPRWAEDASARTLVTALLVGSWDENNEPDNEIIRQLGQEPLNGILKDLSHLLTYPDSPIRKAGTVWKIASPKDAWTHLAGRISSQDLDQLEAVALRVLAARNSAFDLDPKERATLHLREDQPAFSKHLRSGIAETLILLSVFGDTAPGLGRCEERVSHIVRTLLDKTDAARWWSLSDEMKPLAEAAPDAFLAAVDDDLTRDAPDVLTLFVEDGGFFGGEHMSHLLWALEMLAWNSEHLARVSYILARLAQRDPGGRYTNRPKNSLRQIFLIWMPQTNATLVERFKVLDLLRRRTPEVAWPLMLEILPTGRSVGHFSPQPRWRDFSSSKREEVTYAHIGRGVTEITDRLLSDVGNHVTRWLNLIELFASLSPEGRRKAVAQLLETSPKIADESDRTRIRAALRKLLHHHRAFPNAGWALEEKELSPIEELLAAFEPIDSATSDAWLFQPRPELASPSGKGWKADEELSRAARRQAVLKAASGGADRIFGLAAQAPYPGLIGAALAQLPELAEFREKILKRGLESTKQTDQAVAHGLIFESIQLHGETWGNQLIEQARRENSGIDVVIRILRALPVEGRTWQLAKSFGDEVESHYWERVECAWIKGERDDLHEAVEKLTRVGRARDALLVVSQYIEKELDPGILVKVLRDAAQQTPSEHETRDAGFRHGVLEVFQHLDKVAIIPAETMARLEWTYLPLFQFSDREPTQLHRALATDPQLFVQAIRSIFRPSKDAGIVEPASGNPELERATAERAFELLQSWHSIPGQTTEGDIDLAKLEQWVKDARRLCCDYGRKEIGDQYIGQMLSASPPAPDGTWPAEAVREVIEVCQSRDLETGVLVGLVNRRGPTRRGVTDGGKQERSRAADYRAFSKAAAYQWPRTSALLEKAAKDLEQTGLWHDEEARRTEW